MQNARAMGAWLHLPRSEKMLCTKKPKNKLSQGLEDLPQKIPVKAMANGAREAGPLPGFRNCRATSMQFQPVKAISKRLQPEMAAWVNPSKAVGVRLPKTLGTQKLQCAQNVGH